jgi:hypothetical protein
LKRLLPLAAALFLLPTSALADTFTFSPPVTAANTANPSPSSSTANPTNTNYQGGANQFDLDHTKAYTWKISGMSIPAGHTIIGATICFKNIANWDTNANKLFVHLLNTANNSGIRTFTDNSSDATIADYFAGANSLGPSGLGPDNIKLFERSFNKVGQAGYVATDFTHTFSAAQLATLASYIAANGNIAFGFDPDCHYWNNGIVFTFVTASPAPEPVSMVLLGTGLAGLYIRKRRQQKSTKP